MAESRTEDAARGTLPQSGEEVQAPPAPGRVGGRPQGCLNKRTAMVADAIIGIYEPLQADARKEGGLDIEHAHMFEWAKQNPTEFYRMFARLVPLQINADAGPRALKALTWLPPH